MKYPQNENTNNGKVPKSSSKERKEYSINKAKTKKKCWAYFLCKASESFMCFITVTFFDNTKDNTAYELLNTWLTNMRKRKIIETYIWIAERQKNGTIHFHFLINKRVDIQKANTGMRSAIRTKVKNQEMEIDRESLKKYNGVHISKDKYNRVQNLAKSGNKRKTIVNYITKYITKNDTKFYNQVCCCSREVSALPLRMEIDSLEDDHYISEKAIKAISEGVAYETDFCYIYALTEIPDDTIFRLYLYKINLAYETVKAKKEKREINYDWCFPKEKKAIKAKKASSKKQIKQCENQ